MITFIWIMACLFVGFVIGQLFSYYIMTIKVMGLSLRELKALNRLIELRLDDFKKQPLE